MKLALLARTVPWLVGMRIAGWGVGGHWMLFGLLLPMKKN